MYMTASESYQDYLQMQAFRPGMRVKSFEEYWAGRVAAMKLFEAYSANHSANHSANQVNKEQT